MINALYWPKDIQEIDSYLSFDTMTKRPPLHKMEMNGAEALEDITI